VRGFVEIDLVSHDGGNAAGEHAFTLTVTDIATGWTENRSVPNKARKWVLAALDDIAKVMPFPILGLDSDNGSEFINHHLLDWCQKRQITFTRSRPGNSNDGCHVEQKNWAIVRIVVGYHRYDTKAELVLLNKIWMLQSKVTNYFYPQQKLVSKTRVGAKVSKKYDTATTPYRRADTHDTVLDEDKAILADTHDGLNPAAIQRQIQAHTSELLTLTTSKAAPKTKAPVAAPTTRASTNEPPVPPGDASQARKLGRVACRRRRFLGLRKPVNEPGAGARPGRVTHCCFEHAGQNFGSLDRVPQATRPVQCECVWRARQVKKQVKREPEEIPDDDHELVIERVGAIDVAKASGKVCVRASKDAVGRRSSRVWDVAATTGAISELAAQLVADRIERVTVESTSDYWRIWYYLLESAGLSVQLVNARDVKNVPGRPKSDKLDAVWLAKLTEKGLLQPSFVPPAPVRQLRDYTRLRTDLTRERARYWQRLEKLLEDSLIKVSAVASTLDTLSVRDMLEALIAGERDPRRLADLARGRMKTKREALIEALTGRFDDHHAELARMLLDQIDALTVQIATLTTGIEELLAAMPDAQPTETGHRDSTQSCPVTVDTDTAARCADTALLSAVARLDEIPGIGPHGAQVILAEIGLE
jgi:transposase